MAESEKLSASGLKELNATCGLPSAWRGNKRGADRNAQAGLRLAMGWYLRGMAGMLRLGLSDIKSFPEETKCVIRFPHPDFSKSRDDFGREENGLPLSDPDY